MPEKNKKQLESIEQSGRWKGRRTMDKTICEKDEF